MTNCYPQQGGVGNENSVGNNNFYMRPSRWHNYYQPAHYYYPTYWRPQTPAIQTPSFPRQQQQTPTQIESGCSGNMACATACLKVTSISDIIKAPSMYLKYYLLTFSEPILVW